MIKRRVRSRPEIMPPEALQRCGRCGQGTTVVAQERPTIDPRDERGRVRYDQAQRRCPAGHVEETAELILLDGGPTT